MINVPEYLRNAKGAVEALRGNDSNQIQRGKIVDLRERRQERIAFVGDLHGNYASFARIMDHPTIYNGLDSNDISLVFLGDAIHPDKHSIDNYDETDASLFSKLYDMQGSLQIMNGIFDLKSRYSENVFFLLGNHDYYIPRRTNKLFKGKPVEQFTAFNNAARRLGDDYFDQYKKFIDLSPLLFLSINIVAVHAGPIIEERLRDPIDMSDLTSGLKGFNFNLADLDPLTEADPPSSPRTSLLTHLLINCWNIPKRPWTQYGEGDVRKFMIALNREGGFLISGHYHDHISINPHEFAIEPYPRNYIIYSGAQETGFLLYEKGSIKITNV